MSDTKYNGWTNYATWRVKLELFDYANPNDFSSRFERDEAYNLAHDLKEYAENLIYEAGGGNGNIAVDYALAFLQDVNWYEIAEHLIEDYISEYEE
jgi:hypothetical protein